MSEPLILSILFNIFVAGLAVFFSYREEKIKREFNKQKKELSRKYFEANILKEVSDKIGYSLNIKNITETIALSVGEAFDIATVSYALVDGASIRLKTFVKEPVSDAYLQKVKKIMLDAAGGVSKTVREGEVIDERVQEVYEKGRTLTTADSKTVIPDTPQVHFNVPVVVHGKLKGVVTVTASQKDTYYREDMHILYRIVNQAERAIERLEEVIEIEKEKLTSFILSIPSGAILFSYEDGRLRVTTLNDAAKEFLQLKTEPNTLSVLAHFGSDNTLMDKISEALKEKKSMILTDFRIHNKFFKIFINPLLSISEGDSIGISVTMQDVTLEKEIEEMRANFTNMVVHELRSPLISMKGASGLLLSGKVNSEDKKKMLSIIDESAQRMLDQVAELLDAAKLDAGKFTIMKGEADLNQVTKERFGMFSHVAQEKKIIMRILVDNNIKPFMFDAMRIGQVIDNLLSNSIKFTPEGGHITLKTTLENGFVKVIVADDGIGVPKNKKDLLFSKFGQIQQIKKNQGTGLGLYISMGIVESHDGKIWLESEEGKGTTVSFMLPYVTPHEQGAVSSSVLGQGVMN